jgi:glycine/D-amino acid oxidase-like deaminating enzyme
MLNGVKEGWYAKPDAGQLIVSPADEDSMAPQDAWADDMILAEGLSRFEEMMTEPVARITSNWAGLRTFAPDRTLVIGSSPQNPQFFWLAGQGGYGFQTAAAASQLACDLILDRPSELEDGVCQALSPERFKAN